MTKIAEVCGRKRPTNCPTTLLKPQEGTVQPAFPGGPPAKWKKPTAWVRVRKDIARISTASAREAGRGLVRKRYMPKRILEGVVVSDKGEKTVVVKVERTLLAPCSEEDRSSFEEVSRARREPTRYKVGEHRSHRRVRPEVQVEDAGKSFPNASASVISKDLDLMIQMQTNLEVADNSGARRVMCIKVLGRLQAPLRLRSATQIVASVKEAIPRGRVKKGDVVQAPSSCAPAQGRSKRKDGSVIRFDKNGRRHRQQAERA